MYDAVRVLEAQGLVEVQHTDPQQFRAVTLEEAVATLRDRYESRVESLRSSLDAIGTVEDSETAPVQEVWSISDSTAVENRAGRPVDDADDEVVLIVGEGRVLTDDSVETLSDLDPWIDFLVGVVDTALREQIDDALPRANTFVSGLEWLESDGGEPSVGRPMLVDRSSILVSSIVPSGTEHAVYGTGFGNSPWSSPAGCSRRACSRGATLPTSDAAASETHQTATERVGAPSPRRADYQNLRLDFTASRLSSWMCSVSGMFFGHTSVQENCV